MNVLSHSGSPPVSHEHDISWRPWVGGQFKKLLNYFSLVRPPAANNSKWALVATDWLCSLEEHCFFHSQALVSHSSVRLINFISRESLYRCEDSNQKMSKKSSPASQSKLILASEVEETITPVSHTIGLTELTASLEALNTEVDKRSTVVHHTQTSSSSRANKIPGSPDTRDQKKTSPAPIHWPRRYALEMWLEVEVGPRLFVPPEDDSYSVDFATEVINKAYPGCTGMYLDRAGHMLAFYGQKGSTRAGLIQDVAIEASRAVSELPMWMGYTARWRVRCVSLAKANEILAGCKRLEKETRR